MLFKYFNPTLSSGKIWQFGYDRANILHTYAENVITVLKQKSNKYCCSMSVFCKPSLLHTFCLLITHRSISFLVFPCGFVQNTIDTLQFL